MARSANKSSDVDNEVVADEVVVVTVGGNDGRLTSRRVDGSAKQFNFGPVTCFNNDISASSG